MRSVTFPRVFFTWSTKFGYELIRSNEKRFRYDLVWENSVTSGFLSAKKMLMRKHEMIYVFYDKLPLYEEFTKFENAMFAGVSHVYGDTKGSASFKYYPPLPTSILS